MSEEQIQMVAGSTKRLMADLEIGSTDLWMVPPSMLRVKDGFNVRDKDGAYKAAVREYADSMKANGFFRHKPIAGYVAQEDGGDVIYITDGHTRFEAVNLAISEDAVFEKIPVVIHPKGTNMEDLVVQLVKSNEGRPLRPMETARVCQRLVGYGMSESDIAARLGFTKIHVSNMLALIAAPAKVRAMVNDGKVSATAAIDAIKKHGAKAFDVLSDAAAEAKASGKDKITPKQIKKAAAKDAAPIVNEKLLKAIVKAQRKHCKAPGDWFDAFAAELTCASIGAVAQFRAAQVK